MKSILIPISINIFKHQTLHKEVIIHNKLQNHAVKGIYCAYADIQLGLCTLLISPETCKYIQVKSGW